MKFKKIEKNILICSLSVVGLGAIVGTSLAITNELHMNKDPLLSNNNNQNESNKIFSGTTLTKNDVKEIGWDKKTTISLNDWAKQAPKVTQIGDDSSESAPFYANNLLRSIEIPAQITNISNSSFYSTPSLTKVTFEPNSSLTSVGKKAFNNSAIEEISIPQSVKTIGEDAFRNISNLSSDKISLPDELKKSEDPLYGFTEEQWEATKANKMVFNGTILTKAAVNQLGWNKAEITLEDWKNAPNVVEISPAATEGSTDNSAFALLSSIRKITIPARIEKINYSSFWSSSIQEVIFEPGSKLKSLGTNAFFASQLSSIVIPIGTTTIDSFAFASTKISKIIVPNTVTSIGSNAFQKTESTLTGSNIRMPDKFRNANPQYGLASTQWNRIEWLPAPYTGTDLFKTNVVALGWNNRRDITFYDWANEAPNVTRIAGIRSADDTTGNRSAFSGITSLRTIQIPDKVTRIDFSSFARTTNLRQVTFGPNSRLLDIDQDAFNNSGIQNIVIPSTTTRIGQNAFAGTTELNAVTFAPGSKIRSIENGAFLSSNIRSIAIPHSRGLTIGSDVFTGTTLLRGNRVSMPDFLRGSNPNTPKYGFSPTQWNSIVWGESQSQSTILTKDLVNARGWNTKTSITLADWQRDFPNITELGDSSIISGPGTSSPFSFNNNLQSIVIPKTVTKINYAAFFETPNLQSVTFEAGSKLTHINGYVFRKSNIRNIVIPNTVTVIGDAAFDEAKISSINIPKGVTTLDKWVFRKTTNLQTITFEANSTLASIGLETFQESGITSITIPKTVRSIGRYTFLRTRSLRSLTFEPVSQLQSLGHRVFQDTGLRTLVLPNSLSRLEAETFNFSGNIVNITMSSKLRNGSLAPLYSFNASQWNNINWIVEPFNGTTLKRADIINLNWWGKQQITLTDWRLAPNVTHLGVGAATGVINEAPFAGNTTLTDIALPNHLIHIGFNAFSGTTALQTVTFQPTSKVTNIWNQAFDGSGLRSINIPNSVTTIANNAFTATNSLLGAQISMSSNLRRGSLTGQYGFTDEQWNAIVWRIEPFRGATLSKVDVINLNWHTKAEITQRDWTTNAASVTKISSSTSSFDAAAFSKNKVLTKIFIPAKITQINYSSFNAASNLREINFEANSQLSLISTLAFKETALTTINIPDATTEIGFAAFENARRLETIKFNSRTSMLNTIGTNAFIRASALTEIIFPERTKTIGETVFVGATSLRKIYIPNSVTTIHPQAFGSTNNLQGNQVSMLITLREPNPTMPKYGFTQRQWDAIDWRVVPFAGTRLLKENVVKLGWDLKTSITLADWRKDAPSVTEISSPATSGDSPTAAFIDNNRLRNIVIPETITKINFGSFKGTTQLQTVTFEGNPTLSLIGPAAFRQSTINSIIIPASVTQIGNAAFQEAATLRSVTFAPNSTLTTIGTEVFQGTAISSINVPSTVTSIGANAFQNTNSLQGSSVSMDISLRGNLAEVKYGFTPAQWNAIVWRGNVTLTDTVTTSFRINFTEGKNIVDLGPLTPQVSNAITPEATFAGLSLQFGVGPSEGALVIQWGTAQEVKSRIAAYAVNNSILKTQMNIYARMYLPTATGDLNNMIGNVTYNWNKTPVKIYDNQTGIIPNIFVAPNSTTALTDKFIRSYSKIADNWASSLSAGGNKSTEVRVTSLDNSFDIASYTRLGVKLEVNPTADNTSWTEITTFGERTFDAAATNKMKFRLSVIDNKFYEMIGETVQPSTSPTGIVSKIVEKNIEAKIELPNIKAADLVTNKIRVSGTTHNLSIVEDASLYTASGLSLEEAKTYFEIKYSYDNGATYFNSTNFMSELNSLRGNALNSLNLANFKVRYEFTTAGLRKYYSIQVANDAEATQDATKTLVTTGVKKTIDVTTPIADIAKIQISGTTEDITWKGDESIIAIGRLVKVEYGTYVRLNTGVVSYVWSEIVPTSLYTTTTPEGQSNFPLAIRFLPRDGEATGVEIGSIDRNGIFALSNTDKGYAVNANNLLSIINVDTTDLNSVLLFTGFANNLNNGSSTTTIESAALNLVDASFRDQVKLEYQISTLPNAWMSLTALQDYLRTYVSGYTNATSGIIIFDNGIISGETIKAKFVAKDESKFTVVSTTPEVTLNTSGIKTNVDLRTYVNILKTQKVVPTGTSPDNLGTLTIPGMSGGNVPFSGKTFNQIEEILKLVIDIQFKAPGFNNEQWVPLSGITKVNVDNELYIRFVVKDNAKTNIDLSLVTSNDWETHQTTGFKLKLNLPLEIQTDAADLTNLIKLTGNTKELVIDDLEVYKKLVAANAEYENKVEILYTVGKTPMHLDPSNQNKTEFTKDELIALLKQNTVDITADEKQISARFALANGVSAEDFIIKDKSVAILDSSNVLLFINKSNYYALAEKLSVSGTSSEIIWGSDIDELTSTLSKGLILQYSTNPAATATDASNDSKWTAQRPTSIDPADKFLAVRMIVVNGYIFEEKPKLFEVNTTNVLLVITLNSATLDLIQLTGNTKDLGINLTAFNNALATVPGKEFIEVQYYFGGTPPASAGIPAGTEWFSETQIKAILLALKGAKNQNELILFRNALRARYSLNEEGYKTHRMNIDGTFIQENASDNPNFWRLLVTDSVNSGFNGYINLDLINTFVNDSFKVVGSDKRPQLQTSDKIAQMLDYYKDQSTAPFDIYYSKTQGDFSNKAHKLFGTNGFITRFDDTFTIDLDANGLPRPIYFKIEARTGYQIYESNSLLSGGKVIEITNFDIQPQITNPLTVAPEIRFKSATNELFYQGQGSLSVYDRTSGELVDSTFLNKEYPNVLPAVLKLQYNVSDKEYTPEELEAVIADANEWKDIVPNNLKVGQYVMVRVALNNDKFTLLGGDARTPQTRVHGLKVKAQDLRLSENLILTNTEFYGFQALDGQTKIERATILPDSDGLDNYLGADLQMSVNTEFYKNASGKIIVDANNIPIIKRNPQGATASGHYLDSAGVPILDETGQPIPILTIDKNGSKIPAPPLASDTWLSPRNLIDSSIAGSFSQDDDGLLQWRLFEGQTVRFSFIARVGQGTKENPDFIFDSTTPPTPEIQLTNIKYIIPTQGVTYKFDTDQLKNIAFASDTNEGLAYTGSSHISSQLSAIRVAANYEETTIVGNDIEAQVKEDFADRVQIRMKLDKTNGTSTSAFGSDIGQFTGLSNGDVLTISFESVDPNYSLPRPIPPLTIIIKGLFVRPLNTDLFKYLRPNFTGALNGSGAFSIKVTKPGDPLLTNEDVLGTDQWYEYQVWSADKQLKTAWTRDETRINNLVNGDKIEWKIVNKDGVFENDYYNTLLANTDTSDEIKFKVVNVVDKIEQTVQEGIGNSSKLNPDTNGVPNYPENSGWVVSGLKIEINLDEVQQQKFEQALAQFQPTFSGVNQFGSMNSNILNDDAISPNVVIVWYVASEDGMPRRITDFKDAGLSNGDRVWATIAPSQHAIDNNLIIDESIAQMQSKVFVVEGLTTIVNSTTQTLIISLISGSSVLLVGTIGSVIFAKKRGKLSGNKKF